MQCHFFIFGGGGGGGGGGGNNITCLHYHALTLWYMTASVDFPATMYTRAFLTYSLNNKTIITTVITTIVVYTLIKNEIFVFVHLLSFL